MTAPPAERAARVARVRARVIAFWVTAGILIAALAALGVHFSVPGLVVAMWWPAAGVSAVLAVRAPRRLRPLAYAVVFTASLAGNLIAGRPPVLALTYGLANALEMVVFVTVLLGRTPTLRLRTIRDSVRLTVAAAASAVVLGIALGIVAAVIGTPQPIAAAAITAASHFSAVLLIAPLALLSPHPQPAPARTELIAQILVTALIFMSGFGLVVPLPLEFLVFLPLIWATLRFPPLIAHLEAVAIAIAIVVMSAVGASSFALSNLSPTELTLTVVIYLSAVAIFTVSTAAERNDSLGNARAALEAADARTEAARATTATLQLRYDLDRQRQDFLATTSHELRTPVTIIAGYSDLLAEHDLPAESAPWVDAIQRNSTRLTAMLDDLLAFSRRQAVPVAPVDLPASVLVDDVVGARRGEADRRDLAVSIARMPGLSLHADRADATRALDSLVSNAFKFTPDGGRIRIEADIVGDDVMITVTDTGPGMNADTLAQAFDPFYRGEHSEEHAMPGTGLGLSIARILAHRNRGEIMLVASPGRGARASLLLPLASPSGGDDVR